MENLCNTLAFDISKGDLIERPTHKEFSLERRVVIERRHNGEGDLFVN